MAVLEELGSKLTDIAGIKVSFPVKEDKDFIVKIYARLCLMYDETWDCGDSSYALSCKKILRLLNRVGIAHLTPTAADVVDPRRLPRVWSAFLSHLEQKYGSQGLYPRLRKVLKQQQILAARREAERDRLQRIAGSATSPTKSQPGDLSTCSALSQDSQEDVRFAKPLAPVQKVRHASASSSGSVVSPSKGGVRSRIPVPTKLNVIPTGKQLARTPSLGVKRAAPPPAAAQPHKVNVFGSPRLVAPKAAAALAAAAAVTAPAAAPRSPPSPRGRSDGSVTESSTDASPPARRRSLIPAPKTPEQALGEYIERQLNAGFPHGAEPAPGPAGEAATSPQQPAAAPAAATAELNVTYSAERPAAAARTGEQATEQAPSPAADAHEAILQAADNKENLRPARVETGAAEKTAGKPEDPSSQSSSHGPGGSRRDTYEVTAKEENREPNGALDETVPSTAPLTEASASQPAINSAAGDGDPKKVSESVLIEPEPVQAAHAAEKAPKKRRGKTTKKETNDGHGADQDVSHAAVAKSGPVDSVEADVSQKVTETTVKEAPKKRRGRAKKNETTTELAEEETPKTETVDVLKTAESASTENVVAYKAAENQFDSHGADLTEAAGVKEQEAPKKRRGRAKKDDQLAKESMEEVTSKSETVQIVESVPSEVTGTAAEASHDATNSVTSDQLPEPTDAKETAPKKPRGRSKKDAKLAAVTVPEVSAEPSEEQTSSMKADLPEVTEAKPESAEIKEEAPKKHRGRPKKEKPAAAVREPEVGSTSQVAAHTTETATAEVPQAAAVAESAEPQRSESLSSDLTGPVVAEAPKKRRGRAKEAKPASTVAEAGPPAQEPEPVSVPAPPEPAAEQPAAAPEPDGGVTKSAPARQSRRKTAAVRPQKSVESPVTDVGSDPDWTPGAAGAGDRRCAEPAPPAEETVEPAPAAPRGRARRTRHKEPAQTEVGTSELSEQTAEVTGARTGRGRNSRSTAAGPTVTPAATAESATDPATAPASAAAVDPVPADAADPVPTATPVTTTADADSTEQCAATSTTTADKRRSTRGGRKAAEPEQESSAEPAPRRRRKLRVVLESDSEGGTPPARSDTPSPAPSQRARRARKTEAADRPRRALRALENCD